MKRLPAPGTRGGSGITASVSSVRGSSSSSFGPSTPTHTVTIRPRESNVTDAHTPSRNVERFSVWRPSGPGPWCTSDW